MKETILYLQETMKETDSINVPVFSEVSCFVGNPVF